MVTVTTGIVFWLVDRPGGSFWNYLLTSWKFPSIATVTFGVAFQIYTVTKRRLERRNRELEQTVEITSYNFHLGLLRSELCRANTAQSTRAVARPASLRHQSGLRRLLPDCRPSSRNSKRSQPTATSTSTCMRLMTTARGRLVPFAKGHASSHSRLPRLNVRVSPKKIGPVVFVLESD